VAHARQVVALGLVGLFGGQLRVAEGALSFVQQTVRPFAGDQRRRDLQPSVGEIPDLFQTVYLARRLPVLDDTSKEMSARTDPDLRRYRLDRNRRRR
jgi:hypothetical protein